MTDQLATIADQLRQGKTVISFTKGTSMQPLLYEGRSYVVIQPLNAPLQIGDLPIFRRADGKYVLHRIIRMTDTHIITRGDNCVSTETTPREQFLGKVILINRKGKEIRLTDKGYLAYVRFWRISAPLRIGCKRIRIGLSRIRHGIFKA